MEESTIQKGKTQKFIKRLYSVVNDEKIPEIQWSNDGKAIFIPNKDLFKKKAMSHISKAKEYTAFLRSLHHYGFFKLKRPEDDADEYYHKLFVKGQEEQLSDIKRVNEKGRSMLGDIKALKEELSYVQNDLNVQQQNMFEMTNELINLRTLVEKQDKTINGLIDVLSKVFRQGFTTEKAQAALENNLAQMTAGLNLNAPMNAFYKDYKGLPMHKQKAYATMNHVNSFNKNDRMIKRLPEIPNNFGNFLGNENLELYDDKKKKKGNQNSELENESLVLYDMPNFDSPKPKKKDNSEDESFSQMFF